MFIKTIVSKSKTKYTPGPVGVYLQVISGPVLKGPVFKIETGE